MVKQKREFDWYGNGGLVRMGCEKKMEYYFRNRLLAKQKVVNVEILEKRILEEYHKMVIFINNQVYNTK